MNILIYGIAYYYILLSSINDGFSSFFLGIPYASFLIWEIVKKKIKNYTKYLHITILTIAFILIVIDKGALKIIYPIVGKQITIVNDINYSFTNSCLNCIKLHPQYSNDPNKIFSLNKGDVISVNKQIHKGHNFILSNGYFYEISSKRFKELQTYTKQNSEKIKATNDKNEKYINEKYKGITRSIKDPNKFYTDDMFQLLRSQDLENNRYPRFHSNLYVYYSFYIFVYPIILLLFIALLKRREHK